MKVESTIKENCVNTTTEPLKNTEEIINAICEWNGITLDNFRHIVWDYTKIGIDNYWNPIYTQDRDIINPIGAYLVNVYDWKQVVFEKGNDKFFWTIRVRCDNNVRYLLWEKVIEIPYKIKAVNEDTDESITIFPKTSDIIQGWMKSLYVVNTGRAERQRLEKEIMAKLIELSQVKGWNEIISTQNMVEELKETLKKRGVILELTQNWLVSLKFGRRMLRDTAGDDWEYIASPIIVNIDFDSRSVTCNWYSPHWFGTPNSWGNPCRWNWDSDIRNCLRDCDFKGLVNLIISWAYGYNSNDTGISHEWRHPVAKLRDYIWRVYDNRNNPDVITPDIIKNIKENLEWIKHDLNLDDWLDGCSSVREFLSSLEANNETSE